MTENEKKDKLSLVYKFKTKYSVGFLSEETTELLKEFPGINMDKFKWALFGNTCPVIDEEVLKYKHDVYKAIVCGIENRDLSADEFD